MVRILILAAVLVAAPFAAHAGGYYWGRPYWYRPDCFHQGYRYGHPGDDLWHTLNQEGMGLPSLRQRPVPRSGGLGDLPQLPRLGGGLDDD